MSEENKDNSVSLKEHFTKELGHLDDKIGTKLNAILEQTTKTNGRVNKLVEWHDNVEKPLSEIITERDENKKFLEQKKRETKWALGVRVVSYILLFALFGVIQYFVGISALDKVVEYKLKGMSVVVDESAVKPVINKTLAQ